MVVSSGVTKDGSNSVQVIRVMNRKVQYLVMFVISCFTLVYVGLEKTVSTFIPAFGYYGPLHVPEKTGAIISSVYWIKFTSFRLVAIFLSTLFGSTAILALNLVNTILATTLLAFSEYNILLYWFSYAFIGIGLSSTWGSLFGYIELQFAITGRIVSCFTVGACLGSSVIPALISYLMAIDNSIFIWFSLSLF